MSTKRRILPGGAVIVLALAPVLLVLSELRARGDEADGPGPDVAPSVEPLVPGSEGGGAPSESPAGNPPTDEEIRAAIGRLDSDDFVERERTQSLLWGAGARAEAALEEAAKSGSAEARFRASRVLERFRFGIYPDTPREVVELVQAFRQGGPDEQTRAIAELAKRGMFEIVRRLVETVEDDEQAEALARAAARESEVHAAALIANGQLDEAAAILRMNAVTREAMQNFAAFCVLSGTVAAERERIEASGMREKDKLELLHWLARVEGDFPGALALAEKTGDKELVRDTRIASGDLLAFAEGAEDLRLRTLKALGFRATVERMKGDDAAFGKTIDEIEAYAVQHQSEAEDIYTALVANGAVEEALEVARRASPGLAFGHLLEQGRFAEAMEIRGMPGPRPPFDAWLDGQVAKFKAGDDTDEGSTALRNLTEFRSIAAFLDGRGERAYVEKMGGAMAAAAAGKSAKTNHYLARELRKLGAREASLECAARAIDKGEGLEEILDIYGAYASVAGRWSTFLTGRRKLEPKAALREIDGMLTPDDSRSMPPEVAKMIAEAEEIVAKAEKGDEEEVGEWHRTLAETLGFYRQWDRMVSHLERALEVGADDGTLTRRIGQIRLYQRDWDEVAKVFGGLWEADSTDDLSGYLHGLALARTGKVAEGEAIMRRIDLQMLGDTSRRGEIEAILWGQGEVELAERQSRLILALARPYSFECTRASAFLSLRLRYTEREAEAATMMERQMLHALKEGANLTILKAPVASVSALLSVKARAALREGDIEAALALAERALEVSPGDSALLEYLYPMLVESGQKEAADVLFDKVCPVSRAGVALYPGYGQANNNHAWLLARCGKHLDEALRHAEKAVEIEPDSSASVDTLAEVHFARGEFTKAVEVSDRAVALEPSDAQLREQNARFRKAAEAAPAPLP